MARTAKKTAKRGKSLGSQLVESMREIAEALESGQPLEEQLTVRTVEINEPGVYDARKVRRLRARMGVSQAVFAKMMGISTVLVQHWEQGIAAPRPIARRLLDEVSREPSDYANRSIRRAKKSA